MITLLRRGVTFLALCASPLCLASWPTSTTGASATTITVGGTVVISVVAADTDGDLRYVNVDQVSPNAGYYGGTSNTGTETPPGGSAYDLGANYANYTRNLTLTLSTAGTYVFKGMTADNGGSGWQPASNTVTVTVTAGTAPTITAHPQSDTKNAGFDVVFGVSATGSGPFTYQWKKGGTNITGATGGTLTLYNISSADQAGYSVVVTNSAGSVTSNTATLTVTDPNIDTDGDGIPNATETALGTNSSTTTSDGSNTQQQNIHRPTP